MHIDDVKRIFNKHSNDLAFLIGNGINLHYKNDNLSWKDLLLDLWEKHSHDTQTTIPDGITFTEFPQPITVCNPQPITVCNCDGFRHKRFSTNNAVIFSGERESIRHARSEKAVG